MNKTIFISCFNPFIFRNILTSDVLRILKTRIGTKIVIFVPDYKMDFFKEQLNSPNIIIEGIKVWKSSKQDIIFRFLTGSLVDTSTIMVHKKEKLYRDKRYFRFIISWLLIKIFSHIFFIKTFIRSLDSLTVDKKTFLSYILKYNPSLVFSTDVFNDYDIRLLATAQSQKIKTVGMIRSWDNFTTKGVFRIKPNKLIVHNEILKNQAINWNGVSKEDIFVSGIPQYDRYINGKRIDRETFFKKIGLDPKQKLILFSPFGGRFTDTDWQIMEILKNFIKNKEILPSQVLVRCTPNDPVNLGKFLSDENFYIDKPGQGFEGRTTRDQELTDLDMDWLADCLYHSDVIVAGGASIGIDAAIFNKPTILIHFDGFEEKPYWQSVKRFLEYQHPRDIINSGAMLSVKSVEELKQHLNNYLDYPLMDRSARKEMLKNQCWKLDGRSGARIGDFILSLLY
ncbi:MAG: CDP-glycerol glycerophosphotransferase family protein [bacterium]|nr:CDP-glycerol glycerophosphotransferase family protein [bacterium]